MDTQKQNKSLKTILLVILNIFLIALIVFTYVSIQNTIKEGKYIGQEIELKNTLSVSATGTVYAQPDLGIISFSVITEGRTVAVTISENTSKMNKIIDLIKDQKVDEKDLKTTNFNIYPRYEWQRELTDISPTPRKRILIGYEIHQTLQVKIRNLEKIGEIIQIATLAGANQVGNLQFTIDNQDEFKKKAREQAINKAKDKAVELAKQLGVNLVRITNFNESSASPRFYGLERSMAMDMEIMEEAAPQIETGENKIEVNVTITFEIN